MPLEILFVITVLIGSFVLFNWLMGYRKGYIAFNLRNRYYSLNDHAKAVEEKLTNQGKSAVYKGHGYFLIDGETFMLVTRTLPMGGVPLQRTILKPLNKSRAMATSKEE
ncbi:hypothetical protein J2S78_001722 [Salibacterium salarium]|uniref:hypothetical protein n=1 Tax=Salibacterium salarium TaxID=284579 RepID=UPI0027859A56|nr:hypothetical protein [Salibacterium salarium]